MEKRIPLILILVVIMFSLPAQTQTQNQIRFKLWYSMDSTLALPDQDFDSQPEISGYKYSIKAIHQIVPFILEGYLYGWKFDYTPSDKTRNVTEFFDFSSVQSVVITDSHIAYDSPLITDTGTVFSCWITYSLLKYQIDLQQYRNSINFPKISGIGRAPIQDDTDGIIKAFTNAAKNAIRDYYSSIIKNKPKEITGTVYLTSEPRYYVDAGKYVATLDFYLEKDTIQLYHYY